MTTTSWQKVPNVSGFYRRETQQGFVYRFRAPGERVWTRVPGHPGEQGAKQWRNRYLGEDETTRVKPSSARFIDVAEAAIEAKRQLRRSEGTINNDVIHLRCYLHRLHNMKLQEIDRHVLIAKVVKPMETGEFGRRGVPLSGNSIHNALMTVSSVFEYAIDCKPRLASENPARRVRAGEARPSRKSKRKKVVLNSAQLGVLLDQANDTYRPIFATLALTGLRLSEARKLRWEWVDFENRLIWPNGTKNKTSREGSVQLPKKLAAILAELKLQRLDDEFVFVSGSGALFDNRNLQRRLEETIKRIQGAIDPEFPMFSPHHLRHTFASQLLLATGGDIGLASSQTRHSSPATFLSVYAHEVSEAKADRRAADAIDAGLGAAL